MVKINFPLKRESYRERWFIALFLTRKKFKIKKGIIFLKKCLLSLKMEKKTNLRDNLVIYYESKETTGISFIKIMAAPLHGR